MRDNNEIKKDDLVSFKSGSKTNYARVLKVKGKYAWISLHDFKCWGENRTVRIDSLTYEPPVVLTVDKLRKFARFEIRYQELVQGREYADKEIPERYQIVPEDIKAAILNSRKYGLSDDEFGSEYYWLLWDEIYFGVEIEKAINGPDEETEEKKQIPNKYTVFAAAWDMLTRKYEYEEEVSLDDIVTEIQTWEDNKDKPLLEREYTLEQRRDFLKYWNDERIKAATEEMKAAYRKFLDSMCAENDKDALRTKAYACYGEGNAVYGQDWHASMECLLKLMEVDPNPQTANTLGYMYYYGRCTDGVPEYEKAFYYFSIGAAGGYYESRYKLSDMFRHGYGVAKNPEASARLIWLLYDEQVKKIRNGEFGCNFADVALRAGNICKEGIDCYPNPDKAYFYYLQAQFAIRMRMMAEDYYGDQKVAKGIEEAIEEILPKTHYVKPKKTVHFYEAYYVLQHGLRRRHHMEMKIRRLSDYEAKLTCRIVPYESEIYAPKLFVTIPEAHYCGLLEKITLTVKKAYQMEINGDADTIIFDSVSGSDFYYYGKKVANIEGDYAFTVPRSHETSHSFVAVTFSPGGKRYDYLCEIPVQIGDKVIVKVKDEEKEVTIVSVFKKTESELALPLKDYKRILRKA